MIQALAAQQDTIPKRLGRFAVAEFLGRGGMGEVFLVQDGDSGATFALKWLHRTEERHALRFQREFRTLHRLRHPGVIRVYEWGLVADRPFFTMDFVRGRNLGEAVAVVRGGTAVPGTEAMVCAVAALVGRILQPLGYVHAEGVVHRDLKPSNVLVAPSGAIRLMDFGLGLDMSADTRLTTTGFTMGTPAYMAPEQAMGERVDYRADLYAFGVVLFEAVTGQLPFDGQNAVQIAMKHVNELPVPARRRNRVVPQALSELIAALLEKQAHNRPADALDVLATLTGIVGADLLATLAPVASLPPLTVSSSALLPEAETAATAAASPALVTSPLRRPGATGPGAASPTGAADLELQTTSLAPTRLPLVTDSRFVGRDAELAVAQEHLESLLAGQSGLLLWGGESGSGKSRLLAEIRKRALFRPLRVDLAVAAVSDAAPLSVFDGLLRDEAERLEKLLRKGVTELPDPWKRLLPILAKAHYRLYEAARAYGLPEPVPLESEQERFRLLDAIREAIIELARERPLLLLVDDLQWADELSAGAVAVICRSILSGSGRARSNQAGSAVLVIGFYRLGELPEGGVIESLLQALPSHCTRELSCLSEPEGLAMLRSMVPRMEISERMLARIHRAGGGNPFFLEEMLRATVNGESDLAAFGAELTPPVMAAVTPHSRVTPPEPPDDGAVPVPPAVRRALSDRFRRLSPGIQEIVSLASLLGRELQLSLLLELARRSNERLLDDVETAIHQGIFAESRRDGRIWLSFRHDKLREVVAAQIPGSQRRALHGAIAEVLEAHWNEAEHGGADCPTPAEHVFLLAHHFEQADNPRQAVKYLRQACTIAKGATAQEEALAYARRAYEALPDDAAEAERAEVLVELLDLLGRSARYQEALSLSERLLIGARQGGDEVALAQAHHARGKLLIRSGRHEEGVKSFLEGIAVLGERLAQSRSGLVLQFVSRLFTAAIPFGYYRLRNRLRRPERVPRLADRSAPCWRRTAVLFDLYYEICENYFFFMVPYHLLFFGIVIWRMLYLGEALGSAWERILGYSSFAVALLAVPHPKHFAAKRNFRRATELAYRAGLELGIARIAALQSFSSLLISEFDAGRASGARAQQAFEKHGDVYWSILSQWFVGENIFFLGDYATAEEIWEEMRERSLAVGDESCASFATALLSFAAAHRFDFQRAASLAQEARFLARNTSKPALDDILARVDAMVKASSGEIEEAIEILQAAHKRSSPLRVSAFFASALRADLAALLLADMFPAAAPPWADTRDHVARRSTCRLTAAASAPDSQAGPRGSVAFGRVLIEAFHLARGIPFQRAVTLRVVARYNAAKMRPRRARRHYNQALKLFARCGATVELAWTRLELGRFLAGSALDVRKGKELQEEAEEVLSRVGLRGTRPAC
ncbi:MAG: protein kinase [Candidatus Schekmanbacteria bacterium]|nr:protein kinase [Candidatus Schekmanbacteria bacterium]